MLIFCCKSVQVDSHKTTTELLLYQVLIQAVFGQLSNYDEWNHEIIDCLGSSPAAVYET